MGGRGKGGREEERKSRDLCLGHGLCFFLGELLQTGMSGRREGIAGQARVEGEQRWFVGPIWERRVGVIRRESVPLAFFERIGADPI